MTKKHAFYFFLWRVLTFLQGYKVGKFVYTYSDSKKKIVRGVIIGTEGESITRKISEFSFTIAWLEPLRGDNSKFYTRGSYSLGECKKLKEANAKPNVITYG